jgi:hypothetical protein
MPIEHDKASWKTIAWEDNVSQEELLLRRTEQFDQTLAKIAEAIERMKAKRMANKPRFDKKHRLRPTLIQEGDWMLIAEGGLGQDHSSAKKFIQRWREPFVVVICHANLTYTVYKLDGSLHRVPYAGKRVKLFKRRMKFGELEHMGSEDKSEDFHEDDDLKEAQD